MAARKAAPTGPRARGSTTTTSAVASRTAAASRELVGRKEKIDNVRKLLIGYKAEMEMALPRHLSPDRMLRVTMTCIANEPKLLECTRASLVGAVMQLSQLGLEPGILGQAYLLPYRNNKLNVMEAQIIPGYRGLLKLARNSGEISTVSVHPVYDVDEFEYSLGLVEKLHHIPTDQEVKPGQLTHAWAMAKLKDGGVQWEVMNKRQVLGIKNASRGAQSGKSPWTTHEPEMWAKTALRRLCKLLPASVELQTAIALDEAVDVGIPQTFDVIDLAGIEERDEDFDQSGPEDVEDAKEGAN